MSPHLKNNQIPETRYLNSNNTPFNRPATHGAFLLAPKKAGCKLLTLKTIAHYLTKVNKINHNQLFINHLKCTVTNPQLTQKHHYLTKNHLFISFFYSLLLA